jgi:hypothetical protein
MMYLLVCCMGQYYCMLAEHKTYVYIRGKKHAIYFIHVTLSQLNLLQPLFSIFILKSFLIR